MCAISVSFVPLVDSVKVSCDERCVSRSSLADSSCLCPCLAAAFLATTLNRPLAPLGLPGRS